MGRSACCCRSAMFDGRHVGDSRRSCTTIATACPKVGRLEFVLHVSPFCIGPYFLLVRSSDGVDGFELQVGSAHVGFPPRSTQVQSLIMIRKILGVRVRAKILSLLFVIFITLSLIVATYATGPCLAAGV